MPIVLSSGARIISQPNEGFRWISLRVRGYDLELSLFGLEHESIIQLVELSDQRSELGLVGDNGLSRVQISNEFVCCSHFHKPPFGRSMIVRMRHCY